jgi:chemotaxis protein methyltransferase CheR
VSAQRKIVNLDVGDSYADELRELAIVIYKKSGIRITEDRLFLVETRLSGRVKELGLLSFGDYNRVLYRDAAEVQFCIELMTTHKTEWFREIQHFSWLKDQIEFGKLNGQQTPLNIWSAACSSGQEVYSLLFLLIKMGLGHNQFRILGSDISRPVLDTAENLPQSLEFSDQRRKLLLRVPDGNRTNFEIDSALQRSIKFRQFNLIEDELMIPVQFDVIFLRNVLIYFDKPTVLSVCHKLGRKLKPGGFLILGMTESMGDQFADFKSIGTSIYQLKERTK